MSILPNCQFFAPLKVILPTKDAPRKQGEQSQTTCFRRIFKESCSDRLTVKKCSRVYGERH
jgi:hypothetical protein